LYISRWWYRQTIELVGESKPYISIFLDDDIDRLELEGESKPYICIFLDDDIDRLELEGESKLSLIFVYF